VLSNEHPYHDSVRLRNDFGNGQIADCAKLKWVDDACAAQAMNLVHEGEDTMRRNTMLHTLCCALVAAATFAALPAMAQEKRPNVVFILADNVGYGDLGPYGGGELRGSSPNCTFAEFADGLHQSSTSRSYKSLPCRERLGVNSSKSLVTSSSCLRYNI
jgi:hypothetical protein